jgi:aspartyl-tRNA(Asn)/glutamyl-tRNA(Gln) amidotransferase subunit A
LPPPKAIAWHRYLIISKGDVYDPRVRVRILRGEGISAADYIDISMRAARSSRDRAAYRAL